MISLLYLKDTVGNAGSQLLIHVLPHLTELESKAKPNIYFQIVPIKVPFSLS